MDKRSEASLKGVHPDLVTVMRHAAVITRQPFVIIHGLRTVAEEAALVAKGASTTMHSRHLPNKHAMACAVDVAATTNGHIDWTAKLYALIAVAVHDAADVLHIPVEWGGDWRSFKDLGHFQLPWKDYP